MSHNSDDRYYQDTPSIAYLGAERRARPHLDRDTLMEVVRAVQETVDPLTDEERSWVRLAIKREAQSIKLRQAIIEKTLGGLVWAAIVAVGIIAFEYLKSHGVDLTVKK